MNNTYTRNRGMNILEHKTTQKHSMHDRSLTDLWYGRVNGENVHLVLRLNGERVYASVAVFVNVADATVASLGPVVSEGTMEKGMGPEKGTVPAVGSVWT